MQGGRNERPRSSTGREQLRRPSCCQPIDRLNGDPAVHGILVQLPLPPQIDESIVVERVDPAKDVDGFHPANFGLLAAGTPRFVPCTPLGIRELLLEARDRDPGRPCRRSRPIAHRGPAAGVSPASKSPGGEATVTVCHTATPDAAAFARQADILFVAMGRPELVTADWVKPGAVVIDVGIHKKADGRFCGDVEFESVSRVLPISRLFPAASGP